MTAAGTQMARDLADQIAELREQRDALLGLVQQIVESDSQFVTDWDKEAALAIARARRNP